MSSLIYELQRDALDGTATVSELLRKAKVVAVKLDLKDFLIWIESELNSYQDELAPAYRKVTGVWSGLNPYHGWQPIQWPNSKMEELVCTTYCGQKIADLEQLSRSGADSFQMQMSADQIKMITDVISHRVQVRFIVPATTATSIIDSVRNIILDWSLTLEKNGITGDGMSFSTEDRNRAHQPQTIIQVDRIESFTGTMGSISDGATVTVKSNGLQQNTDLVELTNLLRTHISGLGLNDSQGKELHNMVDELDAELKKSSPDDSKMKGIFSSVRSIMQSVSANIIAKGILYELSKHHL